MKKIRYKTKSICIRVNPIALEYLIELQSIMQKSQSDVISDLIYTEIMKHKGRIKASQYNDIL